MPLRSDLTLPASKFQPSAISEQTNKLNEGLMKVTKGGPKWWEVGPARYREMRWNGETVFPAPTLLEAAEDLSIPSREKGREIACRVVRPGNGESKGVFYHIHGGGWTLGGEKYSDTLLQFYASATGCAAVSVGYRLAPEHPYPAGNEDCFDVAEYLADHGKEKFGGQLKFIGGESAGGHLSVCTAFELLRTRPGVKLRGLVLNYGAYDLAGQLPAAQHFDLPLVMDREIMGRFITSYLPSQTEAEKRDPKISPFFADLKTMALPPALFTCGTQDPLLDDSVLFCTRWVMAGGEGVLRIYPGGAHGFNAFPAHLSEQVDKVLEDTKEFLADHS